MPATLTLHDQPGDVTGHDQIVFVGRAQRLLDDATLQLLPSGVDRGAWQRMVRKTDAGDSGRVASTWPSEGPSKVVAAVLPEPCSRHNAPSRAWAIPTVVRAAGTKGSTGVVMVVDHADHAAAAVLSAAKAFPLYSARNPVDRTVGFAVAGPEGAVPVAHLQAAAEGVRQAAELVDTPPNQLTTTEFVARAEAVAEEVGATLTVIRGQELVEAGLGGIWGVGKAAEEPPALVVLDHGGSGGGDCWVGKGIVYDTGGLSLKTKTGMPGMKTDMGGSAAVLAAFRAAVRMGHEGPLTAVLCIAENAIGKGATRPDDVLHMYSGKTVEVNNTDAEGRLVLADGVAWVAKHRSPERVIDLATLTGAQGVATGQIHAALYCSDEQLEHDALRIGRATGDTAHPLPYAPELYRKEFASHIADMKNSVKNRANAQSSCAGQFIGNHLAAAGYDGPWLHIDMAGPATRAGRGTGWGVAMLLGLAGLL
jgi:probable aminopeptidase NPEPL1